MMQQEAGKDQAILRGQGPQAAGQRRTYEKPQLVVLGAGQTRSGSGILFEATTNSNAFRTS